MGETEFFNSRVSKEGAKGAEKNSNTLKIVNCYFKVILYLFKML